MAWIYLIVAGLLEAGWAVGLKYTDGFTRPVPSVLTAGAIMASMLLLAIAARSIPIGTAYAIWVGIGAVGAVTLGIVLFNEPRTAVRIFFIALLVAALIGLKLTDGGAPTVLATRSVNIR
ncbi:MAG: multidrug efflux SMR transporter [Gemmatimonadaceae bacterium]|nr:multidrug efflux SMR transporter [Gemmatimonadaceae bacterium]MDQ3243299.1 multidrug efflux SMR transporter [Gemmatimonadota bacterium]